MFKVSVELPQHKNITWIIQPLKLKMQWFAPTGKVSNIIFLTLFEAFRAIITCSRFIEQHCFFLEQNQDTVISLEQRHSFKCGFRLRCARVHVI